MHVHGHLMNPALNASDISRSREIAIAAQNAAATRKKLASFAALFGETEETADGADRVTMHRDRSGSEREEHDGSGYGSGSGAGSGFGHGQGSSFSVKA